MRYQIRIPSTIIDSIIAFTKFTIEEETGQCLDMEAIKFDNNIEIAKQPKFYSILPHRKFQINKLNYKFDTNTFSNHGIVTINLNHWIDDSLGLGIEFNNFKKEKSILKFHLNEGVISRVESWRFDPKEEQFEKEDFAILDGQQVIETSCKSTYGK